MDFKINGNNPINNPHNDSNNISAQNAEFEQTFNYQATESDRNKGIQVQHNYIETDRKSLGNGIYLVENDKGERYYEIEIEEFDSRDTNVTIDLSLPRKYTMGGKRVVKNHLEGFLRSNSICFDTTAIDRQVVDATSIQIHRTIDPVHIIAEKIPGGGRNQNAGEIGYIVFQPGKYKGQRIIENDSRNTSPNELNNTPQEIEHIQQLLAIRVNSGEIDGKLAQSLIRELNTGNLAFAHQTDIDGNFVNEGEILTLTNEDINLLLQYNKLAKGIKFSKADKLNNLELQFRKEYFKLHKILVDPSTVKPGEILETRTSAKHKDGDRILASDETTVPRTVKSGIERGNGIRGLVPTRSDKRNKRALKRSQEQENQGYYRGFRAVKDLGVNPYNEKGQTIPDVDRVLAECGSNVALDMSTSGKCFTGFKHTLLTAGVIEDYGEMVDENGNSITRPRDAVPWLQARPERFTEVKYIRDEDGTVRVLNSTDVLNLPAGYIGIFVPEDNVRFDEREGHAFTTNGNGQGNADETDNMAWCSFAKGEHGTLHVFRLNQDNWRFNKATQKLEYTGPQTESTRHDTAVRSGIDYRNNGKRARKFMAALYDNKQSLMTTLNISEKQYNYYANIALAISEVETEAGTSTKANFRDRMANNKKINEIATKRYGTLSSGMTRFKVNDCSEQEKRLMEQFGITTGDNNSLDNPKHSAIATIIHLHFLAQDYEKYMSNDNIGITKDETLLNAEEQTELTSFQGLFSGSDSDWQQILTIKKILRHEETAQTPEMESLVNGARLFVDTHVRELDQTEYIAARWNGKRRLPPAKSDKNYERNLDQYYDNMLQVFIDRQRALIAADMIPEVTVKQIPVEQTSYIGHVNMLAQVGYAF